MELLLIFHVLLLFLLKAGSKSTPNSMTYTLTLTKKTLEHNLMEENAYAYQIQHMQQGLVQQVKGMRNMKEFINIFAV